MDDKYEEAKKEVDDIYNDLDNAVMIVTKDIIAPLDNIVQQLSKGINLFSNAELWDFQMRLGIEAYILGHTKEQSSLKDACATALYKEGLARSFVEANGTQEVKRQQSVLDTSGKQAVAMLWTAVSSLLKTKCDEAHRLVSIIQGIQISRAAEAKQQGNPRNEADRVNFTPVNQGD